MLTEDQFQKFMNEYFTAINAQLQQQSRIYDHFYERLHETYKTLGPRERTRIALAIRMVGKRKAREVFKELDNLAIEAVYALHPSLQLTRRRDVDKMFMEVRT